MAILRLPFVNKHKKVIFKGVNTSSEDQMASSFSISKGKMRVEIESRSVRVTKIAVLSSP